MVKHARNMTRSCWVVKTGAVENRTPQVGRGCQQFRRPLRLEQWLSAVSAGIHAVLNFSPGALKVPATVKMKSVDLTVSLESLSFYLAQGIDDEG